MHLSCHLGHQGRRGHGYHLKSTGHVATPTLSELSAFLSSRGPGVYQAVILGGQDSSPSDQPLLSGGL